MRWTAPPDRRETQLLVFAFCVFFLAYYFDNSLRLFGFDPATTHGTVLRTLGFGSSSLISNDGRKPPGWRDSLENIIFGSWTWDDDEVAGDGVEASQKLGKGKHDATWIGRKAVGPLQGGSLGDLSVNDGFLEWGNQVPQSKLVRHIAGYSILDNVVIFDGTVYIVSDETEAFPLSKSVVNSWGLGMNDWRIISTSEARTTLGTYGAILHGVTWMSADSIPHNSTLLSLWRTYSSLDPHIDSSGQTSLPSPTRLFFPQVRVFTDPNPLPHFHMIRRRRVDTGFHPFTLKAAFPQLTVMYQEDWEDYHKLPVPFVIERIVVADREAAEQSVKPGQSLISQVFNLPGSTHWWEPIRQTLLSFLGDAPTKKKTITYIHRQSEVSGVRLRDDDHDALVKGLRKMERSYGYQVNIVSSLFDETDWETRMSAISKSTVLLGPYGGDLLDCLFMKPAPYATLMEFFPDGKFVRDEELVAQSRGISYMAWWNDKKFLSNNLPAMSLPVDGQEAHIDTKAVTKAILEILSS